MVPERILDFFPRPQSKSWKLLFRKYDTGTFGRIRIHFLKKVIRIVLNLMQNPFAKPRPEFSAPDMTESAPCSCILHGGNCCIDNMMNWWLVKAGWESAASRHLLSAEKSEPPFTPPPPLQPASVEVSLSLFAHPPCPLPDSLSSCVQRTLLVWSFMCSAGLVGSIVWREAARTLKMKIKSSTVYFHSSGRNGENANLMPKAGFGNFVCHLILFITKTHTQNQCLYPDK